ncbi:EF-hand domain-containing protein [Zhengella mangrovi]|nr:EF-hand domain-containing protein [Zhengella mangrovi]
MGRGPGMRGQAMFDRADADKSGDVTYEEFSAAMGGRILGADADKNGELTVGEVADVIERMRAERRAEQLIRRFDLNGDGKLTTDEIENRQKKIFALMDRNDDGKVEKDEVGRPGAWGPRGNWGHRDGWGPRGNWGNMPGYGMGRQGMGPGMRGNRPMMDDDD